MESNTEYTARGKWPSEYIARLPGQASLTFKTDGEKILSITFTGRPTINERNSAVAKVSKSISTKPKEEDISHIMSVEVFKQVIKTKYEGISCDVLAAQFKKPYMDLVKLEAIGDGIAKEFLEKFREGTNLHNSGSRNNRLSGAFILLFKRFIEMGKERFENYIANKKSDEPTIEIKIPDLDSGITSSDLQQFLGAKYLFITSWDELLDLYFSVNYDYDLEIQRRKFTKNIMDVLKDRVNKTDKIDLKKACDARDLFLQAYSKFGLYEVGKRTVEKRALNNNNNNNNNNDQQEHPTKLLKSNKSSDITQVSQQDIINKEALVAKATQSPDFFQILIIDGRIGQLTSKELLVIASNNIDSFTLLMNNKLFEQMEIEDLQALKDEYDEYPFEGVGVEEPLETLTAVISSRINCLI